MSGVPLDAATEDLLRTLAPQVLGAVVRRHRDFALCEDAVQEALIAAARQWPREGVPASPRGWLVQVANRRVIDLVRSEVARREREAQVAQETEMEAGTVLDAEFAADDPLVLFFMCCHPALTTASAIALCLRAVGGLTTGEIARAFLVPEKTIGQRISRAKQTIKASGVGFEMPDASERAARLEAVLHVLYLIFNEGYTASHGDQLQRVDLSQQAIRLAREVHRLLPDRSDVMGLLALMLLTDARRAARTGPRGELIPLDEQDRSRWNRQAITEGVALTHASLSRGSIGAYQLQAAIAAVHDEAKRVEDTDWPQVLALYEALRGLADNPVVALNHAVATAMVHGPAAGLSLLEPLAADPRLRDGHRLEAVRAHLLEQAGDGAGAVTAYRRAAARTASLPERDYLLRRAAHLGEAP